MAIWQWSKTAQNNGSSDPTIIFSEGQPPSSLNDADRALMARLAEWRDDTAGILLDTGTASAYLVATNEIVQTPTPTNGTRISFAPLNVNASGVTLAVDGGTAFPIQTSPGVPITASAMVAGTVYDVVFYTSVNAWLIKNLFAQSNPSLVPLGSMIDFVGTVAPNANFALPFGQAISRTTYSALFNTPGVGTTYGAGDGSTTFNIPDLRGRVVAGVDNMGGTTASRLTASGSGITGTTLGASGGSETHILSTAEMPSHSHTANVTDPGHVHTINGSRPLSVGTPVGQSPSSGGNPQCGSLNISIDSATTGITVGISNTGTGNAHTVTQPTMVLNKLLRIL